MPAFRFLPVHETGRRGMAKVFIGVYPHKLSARRSRSTSGMGGASGAGYGVSGCEAVCGLHEQVIGDVGSAVIFVLDDVQGRVGQLLGETPDHTQR
jgi:hypothetical protein